MGSVGDIISGNRPVNNKLPESAHAAIVYVVEHDQKPAQVGREFGVSRQTIHYTIQRVQQHKILALKPRSGVPRKLSALAIRYVF